MSPDILERDSTNYPPVPRGALKLLAPRDRLALEMALHEESERRAMDGELAQLEAQWREAEVIARIADGLFVQPSVEAQLEEMRRRGPRDATSELEGRGS